jgi:hypothetical protein
VLAAGQEGQTESIQRDRERANNWVSLYLSSEMEYFDS